MAGPRASCRPSLAQGFQTILESIPPANSFAGNLWSTTSTGIKIRILKRPQGSFTSLC